MKRKINGRKRGGKTRKTEGKIGGNKGAG